MNQPRTTVELNAIQIIATLLVDVEACDADTARTAADVLVNQLKASGFGIVIERHEVTNLTFSKAVDAIKQGKRLSRVGWNGKGMYVFLVRDQVDRLPIEEEGATGGELRKFLPYVMMRTAEGAFVPWLASQTDILAEDWTTLT